MPDVRSLIETAQTKGLRLFLKEGRVKVQAPSRLDGDMKALIEELRGHREEIKSFLSQVVPPCWNCGEPMSDTKDIYGKDWWACWSCARTA